MDKLEYDKQVEEFCNPTISKEMEELIELEEIVKYKTKQEEIDDFLS